MFHGSREAATRRPGPRLGFGRLLDRLRPLPRVNHVALGTFCHVASALRDAGLRRWTGPFDWIFSTPAMVAECLGDGFAGFLAPDALVSVPAAERTHGAKRQARHRVYEARYGLPALFNHHDPAANAPDRRALARAARRMRSVLGSPRRNQLYMMSEVRWPEAEIAALAERLGAGPAENRLVVVTATGGRAARTRRIAPIGGLACRAIALDLETVSRSNGVLFPDPDDEAFLRDALREVAADFDGRGGA